MPINSHNHCSATYHMFIFNAHAHAHEHAFLVFIITMPGKQLSAIRPPTLRYYKMQSLHLHTVEIIIFLIYCFY